MKQQFKREEEEDRETYSYRERQKECNKKDKQTQIHTL